MKIIDLHCDTIYKLSIYDKEYFITPENLKKGGYAAQCFAVYTPPDIRGEDSFVFFKKQYEIFLKFCKENDITGFSTEKFSTNKIAAVLSVENAEFLNGKIDRLKFAENCGVKFLGLVHNGENCMGFSHSYSKAQNELSLKKFGKEIVDAANYQNLTVDVSHLNYGGFLDVAQLSKKPFTATHSACRELCEHSRNLYDDQIKKIAESGGVVGVPFYSKFLNGGNVTEFSDIVAHLEHLIKIGGENLPALGSDFDGMNCGLFLKNCGEMQVFAEYLIKKFGFCVAEKICYKNAIGLL